MNFERIDLDDFGKYKQFFNEQPYPLCAYSLASILAWSGKEYQPHGAVADDTLVVGVAYTAETQHNHLLLPISPGHRHFSPEMLRELLRTSGYPEFWFVPQTYVTDNGLEEIERYFDIVHHGIYDDYIYLTSDLAFLKGNKYAKKRNLINQFMRKYVDAGRVAVEEITPDTVGECLAFLERWCEARDCDGAENLILRCEKLAAINTLRNMKRLEVNGLLLRIDGEVSAFGIAASLTSEIAVLQYQKADSHIKGLYQYFDSQCAIQLAEGYRYINKESDMGLAGLAKAKKSYHPLTIERSYRLVPKK